MLVAQDVPEIDVKEGVALPRPPVASKAHGCAGCAAGGSGAPGSRWSRCCHPSQEEVVKKLVLIIRRWFCSGAQRPRVLRLLRQRRPAARCFNDATEVVLMRMGTRTVMSMENSYQGPVGDFAMVIRCRSCSTRADVKTLDKAIFAKVDTMGAPRLVEYWEQDPCAPQVDYDRMPMATGAMAKYDEQKEDKPGDLASRSRAQFVVGEYQIVILSATDSSGLDTWLKQEHYQIPEGASRSCGRTSSRARSSSSPRSIPEGHLRR